MRKPFIVEKSPSFKFSVVVPATRPGTVQATIESICRQSIPDWELVVVGQGEDASLRAVVEAYADQDHRVRYHHIELRGASRARNAGLRCTSGEILAFIDDDCEAKADWLETMGQMFDSRPDIGLVGGALIPPAKPGKGMAFCFGFIPEEGVYDPAASPQRAPKGWDWTGSNVSIRRTVIERAGPFDEYLGPGSSFFAAEDPDYKLRLETLGIKMAATPRAVVYHTYGCRTGLWALMKQTRNYTFGTYGLAGKLTLMGDPRGREWMADVRTHCLTNWFRNRKPYRLPVDLYRLWNATSAYRLCLKQYKVQAGLLIPTGR